MVGALEKLVMSHSDWWSVAGYDNAVGDAPAGWFDAAKPVPTESPASAESPSDSRPAPSPIVAALIAERGAPARAPEPARDPLADMPAELAAFQAWLAGSPAAQWGGRVVLPSGPANARLMILSEFPEAEDEESARLHSDRAGELLDAMLGAIGLQRDECYLASFAVTRPPGGRIADDTRQLLDQILAQHIALAAPRHILTLGNRMSRVVGAMDVIDAQTKLLEFNHHGSRVSANAIYHPRFLLGRPQYKAISWTSLKRLRKLL